jgi:type I restriction enzyme S subunit
MKQLPQGWINCHLFEISEVVTGKTPSKKNDEYFNGAIPFIKPGDVRNQGVIESTEETLTEIGADMVTCIPPDSITVTCIGNLGRAAITKVLSTTNQQINSVIPNENISTKFLYYYLRTIKNWMESEASSTTVTIINKGRFLKAPVILPPANEQIRIADKLDSVLAKVDAAQARLKKIPTLLKRFRQSVLAAATSGELTREWREINSEKVTDASLLLEQILKNRRTIWAENEIRKFESKGKMPSGDSWKNKYKIPVSLEIEDRPELPEKWLWTSIDSVSTLITDGKHGDCNDEQGSGYFFLSAKNIIDGKLAYKNARQIIKSEFDEVHFRTNLEPGDICLVNTGATVGKVAIAEDNNLTNRTTFQKSVAVIKLVRPLVLERYFYCFLMGETKRLLKNSTGSAVNNLLLSAIKEFPVPLPPGDEQNEIVRRVESLFALADAVEKQYLAAKQRLDRLSQSVLAKAFRGELVPQDPNDESAAELLKRIQAERQAQAPAKRSRKQPA